MPRKPPRHVVVITGASSTLGQALALEFAVRGDAVVVAAMSEELLEMPKRSCEMLGALTHGCVVPERSPRALREMAQSAIDRFGRIDIWINHAAPFERTEDVAACEAAFKAEMANFDQGARTAMIVFGAQQRGVLVNVDGYANLPYISDEAREAVRAQFAAIEASAASIPNVATHSIITTPGVLWQELAGRVVVLAHSEARGDALGRATAFLTRHRMRLWSTARKAAKRKLVRNDYVSTAVLIGSNKGETRRSSQSDDDGGSRRRGGWHLAHTKDSTEHTTALMALVALPLVMAAVLLALVA